MLNGGCTPLTPSRCYCEELRGDEESDKGRQEEDINRADSSKNKEKCHQQIEET